MAAWATTVQARRHWLDAPLDDEVLEELLTAAQDECQAYAPALAVGAPVPVRFTLAVVYQARELHTAVQRGEQDVIGTGDFVIRARPLTAVVKQLLRPRRFAGVG